MEQHDLRDEVARGRDAREVHREVRCVRLVGDEQGERLDRARELRREMDAWGVGCMH